MIRGNGVCMKDDHNRKPAAVWPMIIRRSLISVFLSICFWMLKSLFSAVHAVNIIEIHIHYTDINGQTGVLGDLLGTMDEPEISE